VSFGDRRFRVGPKLVGDRSILQVRQLWHALARARASGVRAVFADMHHVALFRFAWITSLTAAMLAVIGMVAVAQDVTGPALKAVYVYNFAKFTEWPAETPAGEPFVMCVHGDDAVGDALERAVLGRMLSARRIVVTRVTAADPKQGCRILYLSNTTAARAGQVIAELRDLPVLTISDIEGFIGVGGITEFFFEHGALRFRIDLGAAKRARLQISSKLLIIAAPK
jgi:hypothetical protein